MSENQNGRVRNLWKYDTMTTEELEEILRLDVDALEGQESDTELLLYVMEVLASRKRNTSHTENTAHRAYESFKKNYLSEVEEKIIAPKEKIPAKKKPLRWLRSLSAVAAVLVIILLGSVTAKAFGCDIWEAVVQWTQETFHFGNAREIDGPDTDGDLEFSSLQDALAYAGIEEKLVPTWMPEGYKLVRITVDLTPIQDIYNALYQNGENELVITVRNHLRSTPQYVEQSDNLMEVYKVAGVEYYLFLNHERVRVAWLYGSYECSISGELTIEELKLMIDSIEKG